MGGKSHEFDVASYILNEDLLFTVTECHAMFLLQSSMLWHFLQAFSSPSFALSSTVIFHKLLCSAVCVFSEAVASVFFFPLKDYSNIWR